MGERRSEYNRSRSTSPAAVLETADISFDEFEFAPLFGADHHLYILEVMWRAGNEIVHRRHRLIKIEQRFEQIEPEDAGNTRYKPLPERNKNGWIA